VIRRQRSGEIRGPRGPIFFERDAWGYPRIRARDRVGGAFAHGWLIAADRMAQVYLTRVFGQGRLMELAGDKPLHRLVDRSARLYGFSRDLEASCAGMNARTRSILQAWCDGFNAGARELPRPVVMHLLRMRAEPLRVEDVLLVYRTISFFGLVSQQQAAEGAIAELAAARAPRAAFELLLGDLADGFSPEDLASLKIPKGGLAGVAGAGGSNAVAVAKQRSSTGGALLHCEFHLEIGKIPPALYVLHMEFENGDYLQGANFPGVAWLSAGRTSKVGWTCTFGHCDNIDILVERCENGRYRTKDGWRPLQRREEEVKIRGKKREKWVFNDSEYGVIEGEVDVPGDYPCIRWGGLRAGPRGLETAIATEACTSVDELVAVQRAYTDIPIHALFADDSGRIAHVLTGQVDQRPEGWTGAYPRRGWDLAERAPRPMAEEGRPLVIDPPDGILVSANERVDGPRGERWISFPEPHWRHERLRALLASADELDLDALLTASYDEHDLAAATLVPIWAPHLPDDPDARALVAWAGAQRGENADRMLALFHALHRECFRALLEPRIGAHAAKRILDENGMLLLAFEYPLDRALALERPDVLDAEDLGALLRRAWPRAKERARRQTDGVPVKTPFVNAYFEGKLPAFLGLDAPARTLRGGPVAPFQTRWTTIAGQKFLGGPAFHILFDMSKPGGWYNVSGGASERRFGPGYGQALEAWHEGELAPLGSPVGPPPRLLGRS
jgi:penicillin amidase